VTAYQSIRYERSGHIGTLTLARPEKRNAQNPLMWQELAQLGTELLPDQTLRCLVVAGEGPSFSAGIDLVEGLAEMVGEWTGRLADENTLKLGLAAAGTFSWIPKLSCPSVAAVHGHAYGAGLQLALACSATSSTPLRRSGSGWPTAWWRTTKLSPPRPSSPRAWPLSRRWRYRGRDERSTQRGTAIRMTALLWRCKSRSAALRPTTLKKQARR
jgi:hypothetical protein